MAPDAEGTTLRQAGLIAGFGLLVMVIAAPFAELMVYSRLVVPGDADATVQNIQAGRGLFLSGILAYLVTFIFDVIVAWALYLLLAPVHRSLSLLTAWFRLVYTAIALFSMLKLVTVFRLFESPNDLDVLGSDPPRQVQLLLDTFRYEWGAGLILFGVHLVLLGYLVYRSGYIPRLLGVLLAVAGASWVIYELGPFLAPDADLGFLMIPISGEIVFMIWLLARAWKLPESRASAP